MGRGAEVFEDAHANNGVSWQGLECPNGKRMSLESILNFGARWLSSPGPNTVSPICAQSGTGIPANLPALSRRCSEYGEQSEAGGWSFYRPKN